MTRKVELWEEVIRQHGIDVNQPVSRVKAKDVKRITHEEPRLMAKMDTIEDLPKIFRENDLFLLPISRTEYAIVKGGGYHSIETIDGKPLVHTTQYNFPTSTQGAETEGIYLDYAYSSGLLGSFTGKSSLFLGFRGRRATPKFTFNIDSHELTVDSAQIEVDGSYESNDAIVGVEAKMGIPTSFAVRQLYYPFRTFYGNKTVRNVFFCYEPSGRTYFLWEYEFDPYTKFDGIKLIQAKHYEVKIENAITPKNYRNVEPTISDIPQADSVNKIIEFPFRVLEGYDTSEKMMKAFGFTRRQSSYYRQAVEILGLVSLEGNTYKLTSEGERYTKLPTDRRMNYICERLLRFELMNEIFVKIATDRNAVVSLDDITHLIKERSHLGGSTPRRRAQTTLAWFKWIQGHIGIVEVDRNKNVRIPKQAKLF